MKNDVANRQEEMLSLITSCRESEMSNKEFCKLHGISQAVFYYWQKKLKENSKPTNQGFIPVTLQTPRPIPEDIEIQYPNGVKLKLSASTDIAQVRMYIGLV